MDDGLRSFARPLIALLAVPLVGACAHVGQDEFEAQMADLRQEMHEGDQAVEARLDARMDQIERELDALEAEVRTLEQEFDVEIQRLETAFRFTPPIHFDFDDATLAPQDRPVLDRFAEVVQRAHPAALVTVEGFTDPSGSADYNLQLGQRRADAVAVYLTSTAGLTNPVKAVSYGEDTSRLVAPGAAGPGNGAARANRRVTLVLDFAPEVGEVMTQRAGATSGG